MTTQAQTFVLLAGHRRARIVQSVAEFLSRLSTEVNFEVTIKREAKKRTDPQNRYLFGVAYKILEERTGHSKNDWHTYFCGEHFGWRERQLPGGRMECVPIRTTTTDEDGKADVIDAAEFWDFVERVRSTAAQNEIYIPDPESADMGRWGD